MDIYSLGVLLFMMLTGRKPYDIAQVLSLRYAKVPIDEAPGLKDERWAKVGAGRAQELCCAGEGSSGWSRACGCRACGCMPCHW